MLSPLLEMSLSCSVSLRILEIKAIKPESRPTLQDYITCLECKGLPVTTKTNPRIVYKENTCSVCEGKGSMQRNLAYAHYLGSHGDNILFRSAKKGDTAKAYNVLSEALALMSFYPGGVNIDNLHFEAMSNMVFRKIRKVISFDQFIRKLRKVKNDG